MDPQDLNIQISRNGFYTVTFENTSCLSVKEIRNELSSVGEVCAVILKKNRVFIRFKYKEEAQRALIKYGKILKLHMAFNSKRSHKPQVSVGEDEEEEDDEEEDLKDVKDHKQKTSTPKPKISESNIDSENNDSIHEGKNFCLILSNLPKKYLFKDVKALIEEVKPLWVEMDETKVFNVVVDLMNGDVWISQTENQANYLKITNESEDWFQEAMRFSLIIHIKMVNSSKNFKNYVLERVYNLIWGMNHPDRVVQKHIKDIVQKHLFCWAESNRRFAYVILDSLQKVSYLVEKLNGFVICGEKLVAMEANQLLKWRRYGGKVTA